MTKFQCDLTNPNFTFSYCPSYPAAVAFAVIFSITTAAHVYQAMHYRKPFGMILIMGGLWEVLGYIIRTVSIQHPFVQGTNIAQMLLILLAPLWINAFIYMLVGRMIHYFLDDDRVFGIKARKITMIFVVFDITAFVVQGTGGSMSSSIEMKTALTGLNVYTGGVALQIFFNVVFLAIVGRLHTTAKALLPATCSTNHDVALQSTAAEPSTTPPQSARSARNCATLLYLVYAIIGLILFRNFYRLAEFSSGLNNTILRHEWYAYVFDAIPMTIAMVTLNVVHPGPKLQGPRSDFAEETRALKQAKKERKAAKNGGQVKETCWKTPFVSTRAVQAGDQV